MPPKASLASRGKPRKKACDDDYEAPGEVGSGGLSTADKDHVLAERLLSHIEELTGTKVLLKEATPTEFEEIRIRLEELRALVASFPITASAKKNKVGFSAPDDKESP